jgi:aerobic-type carbon monoxide dehydrogenase small subunit (CoxS/CutS family)
MVTEQTSSIQITVNGEIRYLNLSPDTTVLSALRHDLNLKGTRIGCLEGYCGTCTVLLDGRPVQTCNLSLASVAGHAITTIEAVSADRNSQAVAQAFLDEQAAQCGYCTNGIIMTVIGMVAQNPPANRPEIVAALDERHLCRCGAQRRILRAIDRAVAASGPPR